MLDFPGLCFIVCQWASEIFVLVIFCFEHVRKSVFLLSVLEEFTFDSLSLSISFFGFSLPAVELFLDGIDLFLVLANVVFGLLYFLFVGFVVTDLGVQVELFPFQVAYKAILLINKLVESFNFLCEHNNFVFKILDLDFDSSILIKSLF